MKRMLEYCHQKRTDCALYMNGRCFGLSETYFRKRICPFYKTREETEEQLRMIAKQMTGRGIPGHLEEGSAIDTPFDAFNIS